MNRLWKLRTPSCNQKPWFPDTARLRGLQSRRLQALPGLYVLEPMLSEQGLEHRLVGVIVSRQMNPKPV